MNNLITNILLLFLGVGLLYWGIYSIRIDKKENEGVPYNIGTDLGLVLLGIGLITMQILKFIICLLSYF